MTGMTPVDSKSSERMGTVRAMNGSGTKRMMENRPRDGSSWKDKNLAALKRLERFGSFLRFAKENRWISENPASEIKNPKVTMRPTLPFTHDEMLRILVAVEHESTSAKRQEGPMRPSHLLGLLGDHPSHHPAGYFGRAKNVLQVLPFEESGSVRS